MVGAFRADTHIVKIEADFAADVFALVVGCNVHVSGVVERNFRAVSVLIGLEKVKLKFGAEVYGNTLFGGCFYRVLENFPRVFFKRRTVGAPDIAEHSDNLSP